MDILIFFLLITFFLGSVFGFIFLIKKEKFPEKRKNFFLDKINEIKNLDNKEFEKKILNYDKILDQILKEKNFSGTLGEKMKKFGPNFLNQNDIWFAHKMRNQIAHQINVKISNNNFLKAEKFFLREIKNILK